MESTVSLSEGEAVEVSLTGSQHIWSIDQFDGDSSRFAETLQEPVEADDTGTELMGEAKT